MLSLKKCMDTIYTWKRAPISKSTDMSGGRKLLILANGPSAGNFWKRSGIEELYEAYDIMCMNKAIFQEKERILEIRPKYFILLDPAFFLHRSKENESEKKYVDKMISKINQVFREVNWKAYLITNIYQPIDVGNHINIIRLNQNVIKQGNDTVYKLYKRNLANPGIDTVLEAAIYFGITFGYREMALYGTEFTLFKYISVDEQNRLVNINKHFYEEDKEDSEARIIRNDFYGFEGSAVSYYLHRMAECFNTFYRLRRYADYLNSKVYNYTEDSMIDVFERKRF